MRKVAAFVRQWFAGTFMYDDEPCQVCAHSSCVCE